jgi:ABC-type uncharacterized transport system ATPase component
MNSLLKSQEIVSLYHKKVNSLYDKKKQLENDKYKLKNLKNSYKVHVEYQRLLKLSLETMKKVLKPLTEAGIGSLQTLLTSGLNSIFFDRKYTVEFEIADRGGDKTSEIFLIETLDNGIVRRSSARDGIGGGVASVIGTILQVFNILHYNLWRVLILDEPLSDISDKYYDNVFQFFKELIEEKEFEILMISHDRRLIPYADSIFRVKDGRVERINE